MLNWTLIRNETLHMKLGSRTYAVFASYSEAFRTMPNHSPLFNLFWSAISHALKMLQIWLFFRNACLFRSEHPKRKAIRAYNVRERPHSYKLKIKGCNLLGVSLYPINAIESIHNYNVACTNTHPHTRARTCSRSYVRKYFLIKFIAPAAVAEPQWSLASRISMPSNGNRNAIKNCPQ